MSSISTTNSRFAESTRLPLRRDQDGSDCGSLGSDTGIESEVLISDHILRISVSEYEHGLDGELDREPSYNKTSLSADEPTLPASNLGSEAELAITEKHDSAALRKHLQLQTTPTGSPPIRPWSVTRLKSAPDPIHRETFSHHSPKLSEGVTALLDPEVSVSHTMYKSLKPRKSAKGRLPRKPCLKKHFKSTPVTPRGEVEREEEDSPAAHKLRRVKTVEFETPRQKTGLPTPQASSATNIPARKRADSGLSKAFQAQGTKSSVADPAITHTDVHVIAVAPSWTSTDTLASGEARGPQLATPTMQIIESRSGVYEVVWDNVPDEDERSNRQRRRSSAGDALQAAASATTSGLERVNSKLSDWSWGNGGLGDETTGSTQFKPAIVVFPEDDADLHRQYHYTVDDEDLLVLAPPNSQRHSARSSRQPTRPPSGEHSPERKARFSMHSDRELDLRPCHVEQVTLAVPGQNGGSRPGYSDIRRLSNIDESEMRFRGHRDSVTLARHRIITAGGINPDIFMHRDSVVMAKTRHKRYLATSAAHDVAGPKKRDLDTNYLLSDSEGSASGGTGAAMHSAVALPTSTLLPRSATVNRHIRIME